MCDLGKKELEIFIGQGKRCLSTTNQERAHGSWIGSVGFLFNGRLDLVSLSTEGSTIIISLKMGVPERKVAELYYEIWRAISGL